MDGYAAALVLWGAIFVATVIAEIASQQLITVWFAAGSLVALILGVFHFPIPIQAGVFLVVSIVLLIATRPIVKKLWTFRVKNTNKTEIGQIALVIETIDGEKQTGRARVGGVDWIAESQNGETIEEGASVEVVDLSGARLTVKRLPKK